MLLGIYTALAVLIVDQVTKYWVLNDVLAERGVVVYSSFFSLVRAWNTGVSFSMFNNWGTAGVIALSLVSLTIVVFLLLWLKSEKERIIQVALGFIIGGACGNVIDRVRLGAVFDFLDFSVGDYHWPAFNAADSFICIGAGLIIFHSLFIRQAEVKQ
ncbi:MAG: signal peptidase II [Alphaproteobacteria bacterium]|nr:signal peptidase II [Alphaproteobacteria bacterium]